MDGMVILTIAWCAGFLFLPWVFWCARGSKKRMKGLIACLIIHWLLGALAIGISLYRETTVEYFLYDIQLVVFGGLYVTGSFVDELFEKNKVRRFFYEISLICGLYAISMLIFAITDSRSLQMFSFSLMLCCYGIAKLRDKKNKSL